MALVEAKGTKLEAEAERDLVTRDGESCDPSPLFDRVELVDGISCLYQHCSQEVSTKHSRAVAGSTSSPRAHRPAHGAQHNPGLA